MISSPWLLLLVGAVGASATMALLWAVSVRIGNASYVDVAWALGIAATAVAYGLLADGSTLMDPLHYVQGVDDVFVNGTHVVAGGEHTGARPGVHLART